MNAMLSSRRLDISIEPHVLQSFTRKAEAIQPSGHAAINCDLQANLSYFLFGKAVIDGAADMDLEFVRTIERRDHSQVQ